MTIIKSPLLDKLQPYLSKAVTVIKEAIAEKRPILIRHHADTDGYSAAIALQLAITPLLYKTHARERDMMYYYKRAPSLTPYYNNEDALRDITHFLENSEKFQHKTPLIILCDFGTSNQSLTALKLIKLYGAKIIVIDHHFPDKEIEETSDLLVNPHLIGSDYDFCTGMLCAEIAFALQPTTDYLFLIAAVAGHADKVKSKEYEQYFEICKQHVITIEEVKAIAICLDYLAFELGNKNSQELILNLFQYNSQKHKDLIQILLPEINEKMKAQLESNLLYAKIDHHKDKIIVQLEINKAKKESEFPPRGKCTGMLHDYMKQNNKLPIITIGYTKTAITFRCSNEIEEFSVPKLVQLLQEKFPAAQVDGGGHRVAGSINFIECAFQDVKKIVDEYVEKIR